jgi:Ca2+-binding RTX toxin-like protein
VSQTTLDFNAVFPASYVDTLVVNEPILEDGYRLASSGNPDEPIQFISYGSEYAPGGPSSGVNYNGPGVVSNPGSYLTGTRLSRADGQGFDLVSIQIDSVYSFFETPRPAIVTFTGERASGGPVTATFTTDTAAGLQTFTLPSGFTGLTSVSWNYETVFSPPDPTQNTDYQQNQWDNIVVRAGAAPPPPGGQTVPGTDGADNLTGGAGADSIAGRGGDDDLRGLSGADTLDGGAGFDGLVGGDGADRFVLTGGNEWIEDFQPGVDKLVLRNGFAPANVTGRTVTFDWGEQGFELRYGPGGGDLAFMRGVSAIGSGDVIAAGGTEPPPPPPPPPPGGQTVPGTDGPDNLGGGTGADSLAGRGGDDDLRGLGGADTLDGGAGFDGLVGGEGADRFVLTGGNEWIEDFAPGVDKLVLRNGFDPGAVTGRVITFGWGEQGFELRYGAGAGDLAFMRGVSGLQAGDVIGEGGTEPPPPPPPPPPGGQTVPGTGGPDNLSGGPGADSLSGGGGDDDLRGLAGADTLDGGAGFDGLVGGEGADRFVLTGGNEWIEDFAPGVDKLVLRNGFNPASATGRTVTFDWGEQGYEVRYGAGAGDLVFMRGVSALQAGDVIA